MTTYRVAATRAVACAFALALMFGPAMPAAFAATKPPTVSRVSVAPRQLFTSTGVKLRSGDTITIRATGRIHFGTSPIDRVAPAGVPQGPNCQKVNARAGHAAKLFPDPSADCWSLIGRIGTGPIFAVGAAKTLKATSKGELLLGVNDNFLGDNKGSWSVVLVLTAAPAKSSTISPLLLLVAAVVLVALILMVVLVVRARRRPEPDSDPRGRPAAVVKPRSGSAAARKARGRPDPTPPPAPVEAAGSAIPAELALRPRGSSPVDNGEFTDTNIFEVEFADQASLHVGYNYFPEGTTVYWRVASHAHPVAAGEFVTDGGGNTYHFVTLPLGVELQPDPGGADVHFAWAIGGVPFQYSVRRDPAH